MTVRFRVESGISIIGRGFVLVGKILTGEIAVGMCAMLPVNWGMGDSVRIDGLELINITSGMRVGLLFQCDAQMIERWKEVIVAEHTIDVIDS